MFKEADGEVKEVFVCQNCGALRPNGRGNAPACGEWNTLVAERPPRQSAQAAGSPRAPGGCVHFAWPPKPLHEQPRLATGSAELDRVLGGGLVPGSVTLIGGDPGIGKSTLMLQAAAASTLGRCCMPPARNR
jgi:DNA repair protein RadA/Sms